MLVEECDDYVTLKASSTPLVMLDSIDCGNNVLLILQNAYDYFINISTGDANST